MADKCKGLTQAGEPCRNKATLGEYCKVHHPDRVDEVPEKKENKADTSDELRALKLKRKQLAERFKNTDSHLMKKLRSISRKIGAIDEQIEKLES